jgi:uncharacterized protein
MSEQKMIEAVKNGDRKALEGLLAARADLNEQDEQGWTPLSWAAGSGDTETIQLLLENGADVALTGRDRRSPLMIAEAAERTAAAALLAQAEKELGIWVDPRENQPYCRAYYLREMRRFPGWSESWINWREAAAHGGNGAGEAELNDSTIVYLHQDFTVTKSMWREESVIFNRVTPEWQEFCSTELAFTVPEEFL